nr:MAG: RNA dependent RNA polymerase [Picornaviridae sp.]
MREHPHMMPLGQKGTIHFELSLYCTMTDNQMNPRFNSMRKPLLKRSSFASVTPNNTPVLREPRVSFNVIPPAYTPPKQRATQAQVSWFYDFCCGPRERHSRAASPPPAPLQMWSWDGFTSCDAYEFMAELSVSRSFARDALEEIQKHSPEFSGNQEFDEAVEALTMRASLLEEELSCRHEEGRRLGFWHNHWSEADGDLDRLYLNFYDENSHCSAEEDWEGESLPVALGDVSDEESLILPAVEVESYSPNWDDYALYLRAVSLTPLGDSANPLLGYEECAINGIVPYDEVEVLEGLDEDNAVHRFWSMLPRRLRGYFVLEAGPQLVGELKQLRRGEYDLDVPLWADEPDAYAQLGVVNGFRVEGKSRRLPDQMNAETREIRLKHLRHMERKVYVIVMEALLDNRAYSWVEQTVYVNPLWRHCLRSIFSSGDHPYLGKMIAADPLLTPLRSRSFAGFSKTPRGGFVAQGASGSKGAKQDPGVFESFQKLWRRFPKDVETYSGVMDTLGASGAVMRILADIFTPSTIAVIVTLCRTEDVYIIVAQLVILASQPFMARMRRTFMNLIMSSGLLDPAETKKVIDSHFQIQGMASPKDIGIIPEMLKGVKHSSVRTKLLSVFATLMGSRIFPEMPDAVAFGVKALNHSARASGETIDLMDSIVDLMLTCHKNIMTFSTTGDWKDLLGGVSEEEVAAELIVLKELVDGLYCHTNVDLDGTFMRCERFMTVTTRLTLNPGLVGEIGRFREVFEEAKRCRGSDRLQPVGFIIVGPPGCGKSYLAEEIHKAWKAHCGYREDNVVMLTYQPSVKHQTVPLATRIVFVNDYLNQKDEVLEETPVSLLQRIVDIADMRVETASIAEKHRSSIRPDIVLVTTNTEKFCCSTSVGGAEKLNRRYVVIRGSYTEAAVAKAKELNVDVDQVQYLAFSEKNVDYVAYQLSSPPGRDIILEQKPGWSLALNGCQDVVSYVISKAIKRKPGEHLGEIPRCKLCSARGNHRCFALEGGQSSKMEWDHEMEEEGVITPDEAAAYHAVTQVVVPSPWWTREAPKICGGVVATIAGASALFMFIQFVREKPQGTVYSSAAPVPVEHNYVESFQKGNVPWLAPSAQDYLVRVRNVTTDYILHGLLACPNLLVLNTHFFEMATACKEGHEVELTGSFGVRTFVFRKQMWVQDGFDTSWLWLPHLDGVVASCGRKFPDFPSSYVGTGSFKGGVAHFADFMVREGPSTKPGDCGIPYIASSGMIFAIHRGAFGDNTPLGSPVSRDGLNMAKRIFLSRGLEVHDDAWDVPKGFGKLVAEGMIGPTVGIHPRSDASWMVAKGQIDLLEKDHVPLGHTPSADRPKMTGRRTSVFDHFSHLLGQEYGPPYVGKPLPPDYVSTTTRRLNSMGHCAPDVDLIALGRSVDAALEDIPSPRVPLGPLTLHQAICGDPRNSLMSPRDDTKSVGHNLKLLGVGRLEAFKPLGDGVYDVHPAVLEDVARLERCLEEGIAPLGFASATVKDEVYSAKKLAENKSRFFFVMDVSFNLVLRRYVLPLLTYLLARPFDSSIIGIINPGSAQWGQLHNYLHRHQDQLFYDSDQSAYDQKHAFMMPFYSNFMRRLALKLGYSDKDAGKVAALLNALSRYVLVMEGNYYLCSSGLSSGRADTLVANSVISKLSIYYCYYSEAASLGLEPPRPSDVLTLANCGDDNITAVRAGFDWFNGEVMKKRQLSLGYVLTDADKREFILAKDFGAIRFLKRLFVWREGVCYGPLEEESIVKSLCYLTGKFTPDEERERNRNTAVSAAREWFLHGPEKFAERRALLVSVFGEALIPTWDELRQEYDSGVFESWSPKPAAMRGLKPLASGSPTAL